MSTPATPGGPNRNVLIGAGIGCGCFSLIVGILAVVLIFVVPKPQPGPQPQPQPQPLPQPQPQPQPGPQPQGEGPDDFKVRLAMVKVVGDGNNVQPGAPTETFTRGEAVGAFGDFVLIRGTHNIVVLWAKIDGQKPVPVAEPRIIKMGEELQGQTFFERLRGAPPGTYGFALGKVVNEQMQPIAIRRFRVQ